MQDIRQSAHQSLLQETIAVTGAASGIGSEVARLALEAGAKVALLDRDEDGLSQVRERLHGAQEGRIHAEVLDIGDEAAVEAAFDRVAAELGPVGGLVASAGIERMGIAHELSSATFDEVIATNVRGTFLCARAAIAQMLRAKIPGSLVLVSSTLGRTAASAITAYGTSKGAISALARSLAVDYAAHGIRANALLPGPTDTALMWAGMSEEQIAAAREAVAAEVPMGRLAKPAEPAAAAIWLLSEQASYVTGSEIACDGGVLAKSSVSV